MGQTNYRLRIAAESEMEKARHPGSVLIVNQHTYIPPAAAGITERTGCLYG